jgi:MFS family permease
VWRTRETTLKVSQVSTAIPGIVSRFQSLDEVTWIPGAYFLTQAGLILTAGQLLTVFPPKYVYVCSIAIFEIGSLVCAVAPSMTALIIGRAVAGCGAAASVLSHLAAHRLIFPLSQDVHISLHDRCRGMYYVLLFPKLIVAPSR